MNSAYANFTELRLILQEFLRQPPEYLIGTAAGILTWIIMGYLLFHKKIFQSQRRAAEKYTKMGHRIEAELIRVTRHRRNEKVLLSARYRYTVNGQTYERNYLVNGPAPDKTYVYYKKNPEKAMIYGDFKEKYEYVLWFVIPLAVSLGSTLLSALLLH